MRETTSAIISRRERPFVGWVAIDEFEDLYARISGARIFVPRLRRFREGFLGRVQGKVLGGFARLDDIPSRGELLFVVARGPGDLEVISSVGHIRKNYRHVAAFVVDSYFVDAFGPAAAKYDHIFCTTELGAETIRKRFGTSTSVLRQGFDCLKWSSVDNSRSIDLIGFGRQSAKYHEAFQSSFHRHDSPILYLHSPIGKVEGADVWVERPMLLKLLQRSKLSLAFHLGVEPPLSRPYDASFVTSRWFESLSCGCLVVGKRPPGSMAEEMLPWQDATIELPDDTRRAVEFIANLAEDVTFQQQVRQRNVAEMRRRHDWRYRIRDIHLHFGLQLPEILTAELDLLVDA